VCVCVCVCHSVLKKTTKRTVFDGIAYSKTFLTVDERSGAPTTEEALP